MDRGRRSRVRAARRNITQPPPLPTVAAPPPRPIGGTTAEAVAWGIRLVEPLFDLLSAECRGALRVAIEGGIPEAAFTTVEAEVRAWASPFYASVSGFYPRASEEEKAAADRRRYDLSARHDAARATLEVLSAYGAQRRRESEASIGRHLDAALFLAQCAGNAYAASGGDRSLCVSTGTIAARPKMIVRSYSSARDQHFVDLH